MLSSFVQREKSSETEWVQIFDEWSGLILEASGLGEFRINVLLPNRSEKTQRSFKLCQLPFRHLTIFYYLKRIHIK